MPAEQARHRFVQTPHGRIHYLDTGTTGTPLILLHSNGMSAYEYQDVIAPLAKRHRVLAWDMPGHGDSEPIARHYTIGDYADAVIGFMDALEIKQAHVLGSSVGGSICIDLGSRYGKRIASLLIVETPTRTFDEWGDHWWTVEQVFGLQPQSFEQVAPRLWRLTPPLLLRWNIDRNKAGVRTMIDVMWAIREFDLTKALPKVKSKSIVVYGENGPVLDGRKVFEKYLSKAPQVVMPKCGHFPMFDDPGAFVDVVLGFTKA
jgi:pimeloyl-ACP methyl ester carboxylesterase